MNMCITVPHLRRDVQQFPLVWNWSLPAFVFEACVYVQKVWKLAMKISRARQQKSLLTSNDTDVSIFFHCQFFTEFSSHRLRTFQSNQWLWSTPQMDTLAWQQLWAFVTVKQKQTKTTGQTNGERLWNFVVWLTVWNEAAQTQATQFPLLVQWRKFRNNRTLCNFYAGKQEQYSITSLKQLVCEQILLLFPRAVACGFIIFTLNLTLDVARFYWYFSSSRFLAVFQSKVVIHLEIDLYAPSAQWKVAYPGCSETRAKSQVRFWTRKLQFVPQKKQVFSAFLRFLVHMIWKPNLMSGLSRTTRIRHLCISRKRSEIHKTKPRHKFSGSPFATDHCQASPFVRENDEHRLRTRNFRSNWPTRR